MFFKKHKLQLILFFLVILGAIFLLVITYSIINREKEKLKIRLDNNHKDVIVVFNSGIQKLNFITAGISSYVKESEIEDLTEKKLFTYLKSQINMTIYRDSIAASLVDTNQIFKIAVTSTQIDPAKLVGRSVIDIRKGKDINILDSIIKIEGSSLVEPFNLQEGWVGIAMNHGIHKNNKPYGYVAVIVDLKYILNNIYETVDTSDFVYRFTTNKGVDFDRHNVYDGTETNVLKDTQSFRNFKINDADIVYSYHNFYGLIIRVGTAYKKEPEILVFDFIYPVFIVLFCYILFIAYQVWRTEKLNTKLSIVSKNLEEKNNDFLNSFNYARRIQTAILPNKNYIQNGLKDSFIFYKPKNIVSGDFYWYNVVDNKKIIAAVDCTGHGVPGALMATIGNSSLNSIVLNDKITTPNIILQELDIRVTSLLKQDTDSNSKDGMDIALCTIDTKSKTLEFSGALRPLYLIRNHEIIIYKGDRFPIGGLNLDQEKTYSNCSINYQKDDMFYLFTDGIADQFGGIYLKKYMQKQFKDLLLSIYQLPTDQQKEIINNTFINWKGNQDQTDDILIVGFRL